MFLSRAPGPLADRAIQQLQVLTLQEPSLIQNIEALIFASEEAVSAAALRQVLDNAVSVQDIEQAVEELNALYDASERTFRIVEVAGGYRFLSRPFVAPLLKKLQTPRLRRKLSQSVLEVLAVIAYRQPVSRSDIQHVRGVSPDYAINKLLERGLVDVRGRARTVGKPLLYGTTKEFLDLFQLSSLADLPKLREIKELVQDKEIQDYLASPSDDDQEQQKREDEKNTGK
jgi:segregation and condensation protein B